MKKLAAGVKPRPRPVFDAVLAAACFVATMLLMSFLMTA
jgi:hypothetical protein